MKKGGALYYLFTPAGLIYISPDTGAAAYRGKITLNNYPLLPIKVPLECPACL